MTTGFDALQNELQLPKTAVQALEQPHPFVSLVLPPFHDDLRTELGQLPSSLTPQRELVRSKWLNKTRTLLVLHKLYEFSSL